jgi:glyoxylase-like metal-dependent hydrolase (beta-lactamase superfamily II)
MEIMDQIAIIPGQSWASNVYVVGKEDLALIDSGLNGDFESYIIRQIESLGLQPNRIKKLVITHFHPDHIGGVLEIVNFCDPQVMVHEIEARYIEEKMGITVQVKLKDGDMIQLGSMNFQVIHTPGHSPGAICLYNAEKKVLFSGDTVFAFGIGRTDIPGGSIGELKKSIKRLTELDVQVLLPGHDVPVLGNANENIQINYSFIESVADDY